MIPNSSKPVRLQLSRRKGFDLQAVSMEANGLPCVNVARPTKWGNPFTPGIVIIPARFTVNGEAIATTADVEFCLELYEAHVFYEQLPFTELRGKNLACWCPVDSPCHADILLELANG